MRLIVYEQDSLVRDDISETSADEFPDQTVHIAETPDEIPKAVVASPGPTVIVLSLPLRFGQTEFRKLAGKVGTARFVLVANTSAPPFELPVGSVYVSRPFTSEILIRAIKSARGFQPERLS